MQGRQNLIFLIYFCYRVSESLFQPSIRLFIYNKIIDLESHNSFSINSTYKTNSTKFYFKSIEEENLLQSISTNYITIYRILINLPAVLLTLFLGGWSDKFGRKTILLLPCCGAIICCLILSVEAVEGVNKTYLAIYVVMLAVLIYGLFGKSSLITMGCNSYVVDCCKLELRTELLGRLLGMNFFGIFVGSFLVGLVTYLEGFKSVLLIIGITNVILVLLILFVIPETVSKPTESFDETTNLVQNDEEKTNKSSSNKTHWSLLRFIRRPRNGNSRWYLLWLFLSVFWNQCAKAGEQDVILLYVKHSPMNWSDEIYGYYLATYYGFMGINLVVTLPIIQHLYSKYCSKTESTIPDCGLIIFGLLMKSVRLIITGSTTNLWLLFASAVLGSSAGWIMASIKSLLSKLTYSDEIGVTFSILSSIEAISSLVGPIIFNYSYNFSVFLYIGTIFYVDAGLQIICVIGFVQLYLSTSKHYDIVN